MAHPATYLKTLTDLKEIVDTLQTQVRQMQNVVPPPMMPPPMHPPYPMMPMNGFYPPHGYYPPMHMMPPLPSSILQPMPPLSSALPTGLMGPSVATSSAATLNAVPLKNSVPLHNPNDPKAMPVVPIAPSAHHQTRKMIPNRDVKPLHHAKEDDREIAPFILSDLLQEGEEMSLRIIVGTGEDGYAMYSTCVTRFDGSTLHVISCEDVPEMVKKSSEKPGELLYQFMNKLHQKGKLRRTFSIAPWKLCYVQRDGKWVSLNRLRKQ